MSIHKIVLTYVNKILKKIRKTRQMNRQCRNNNNKQKKKKDFEKTRRISEGRFTCTLS